MSGGMRRKGSVSYSPFAGKGSYNSTLNSFDFTDACHDCGKERYRQVRETGAITLSKGVCPICKEEKTIVPANDWAYMAGDKRGVLD